eukprot:Amastigsp_a693192_6.p2 type:complete len:151 gc:universal Amastigsp_a693192_6:649-197(-)
MSNVRLCRWNRGLSSVLPAVSRRPVKTPAAVAAEFTAALVAAGVNAELARTLVLGIQQSSGGAAPGFTLNNILDQCDRWRIPKASDRPLDPDAPLTSLDAEACVICMDARREYAIVPCGHMCLCVGCRSGLSACPVCRAPITSLMRIFLD